MYHNKLFKIGIVLIIPLLLLNTPFYSETKSNGSDNKQSQKTENKQIIKKNITFAIVYPVGHPFFETVTSNAKETAEKLGVNLLIMAPHSPDANKQGEIMNHLISEKVDGIAIGPTDSDIITPYINQAINSGINVICFDTDAPNSERLAYIGTHNKLAGKHLAIVAAKKLEEKGKVIISSGLPTMHNLNERIEGVMQVFEHYPQIEVVDIKYSNGTSTKTLENIEKMIDHHPDFDAYIGIDSLSGPAAVTVRKAHGLHKTAVTFDDLPVVLDGIANGLITSTITQNQSLWGELVVERLYALYQKENIPIVENTRTMEIHKDNIDDFLP